MEKDKEFAKLIEESESKTGKKQKKAIKDK